MNKPTITAPDFGSMNLSELLEPRVTKLLPAITDKDRIAYWAARGTQRLKGRVVSHIEYHEIDWSHAPVIVFTDGSALLLQSDDEGNGPGAGHLTNPEGESVDLLCTV